MLIADLLLRHLERDAGNSARPHLNRQVYEVLRGALHRGEWAAGSKLPSSRELAEDTGLSRNTVLFAYQQLLAEGYIVARGGSGTYVNNTWPERPTTARRPAARGGETGARGVPAKAAAQPISRRGELLLRDAGVSESPVGAFALGVSDTALFPHATWARLLNRRWRHPPAELLTYAHGGGFLPLRRALAEHLRLSRSVNCEADQVVVTTGVHQSIALVCHMLADAGDHAWLENPGYRGARSLLRAAGLEVVPVPVDHDGLAPDEATLAQPPRLMYVTPSHQFPLGMVMSVTRRQRLLEYAHRHGSWILEDDYDSEFRFEGRPLPSLHGIDDHGRVVYMGSLSKTLFPGVRIGYLVLPPSVAERCAAGFSELYREGQLVQQAALADFIGEGHLAVHLRRMRRRYARKQAILRAAITRRLGADWPISTHEAGMHLVLHLPDDLPPGRDDVALCVAARAAGVVVRPLSRHYIDGTPARQGLLLGYAGVPEDGIEPAFERLARAIEPALLRDTAGFAAAG
ncbi:MocR-like pyridoxine biosynthesis transcription factor PdxR [Pseudorhodoferax sp.]|uniref:MocR-like pyridoxine biosynthesis transcription factor PdxR n=1 Tax=Pseudorhodoferax sp. TaxID=1993553 RepID=UPI002DD65306|nr:PLP-dependent aminotransferase family protein [Pseudorhodoferax sp.]